jgi:hypothetical protein
MPDDTRTIPAQCEPQTTSIGGPPEESKADEIRAQAAAWQEVARRARESCQRGEAAAKELRRRRNTSGQ